METTMAALTDFSALRQAAPPADSPLGGTPPPPAAPYTNGQFESVGAHLDLLSADTWDDDTTTLSGYYQNEASPAGSGSGSESPLSFASLQTPGFMASNMAAMTGVSPTGSSIADDASQTGCGYTNTLPVAFYSGDSCSSSQDEFGVFSDPSLYHHHQQQQQQHQQHLYQQQQFQHPHYNQHIQQPAAARNMNIDGKFQAPSFPNYRYQFDPRNNPYSVPGRGTQRTLGVNGKPKRKRVINKDQRSAANIRERRRMCTLNDAFEGLRERVPTFSYEKKLSRIETLKLAMTYIQFMSDVLTKDGADFDEAMTSWRKTGGP